ncbi:protein C19orf12 homolog [Centruroides sculpturatus]|uniref:protein C19orf12 homolog n=1 Tax=Centruroides sculpturatus TaxID=218467 RepID=UPI000C6D0607|nr:protein C19orf12 homolog [Centruroides sculpturatus]XP_023233028.1 protein C19orf12 homolog [Centruroides sculpturatus]XP_023233029.1 protein C19orf12 homolog [Centruroides sculpturatus]XP_023233030.1 protein C19orf12 homolog [Centruroides sculpturatus]XP_023233031.1 protein C19orf12 homolog [Centruroides sculpturatus]
MPVNMQDVVEVVCVLADEENIRIAVKESVKGGIITGVAVVVGGVALGPIGLAIGGTLGGIYSAIVASGKFKSAAEIIRCMRDEDKERLVNAVLQVANNFDINDVTRLAALIAGDTILREQILNTVITYLRSEMKMQIID